KDPNTQRAELSKGQLDQDLDQKLIEKGLSEQKSFPNEEVLEKQRMSKK
ncbi:12857_t:CDS:2, partial [Gigaspora rosea]